MGSTPPSFPPANPPPRPVVEDLAGATSLPAASASEGTSGRREPSLRVNTDVVDRPLVREASLPAPPARKAPPRDGVSNRLAGRLAELKAAQSKARRTRVGIGAGVGLVVLVGAWLVGASPFLALNEDEVTVMGGAPSDLQEKVSAAIDPYVGVPLILVDTDDIAQVLVQEAVIKDAQVVRQWPTGLQVQLQVRTPVAASKGESGYSILDRDGVVLSEEQEAPESLPILDIPVGTEHTATALVAVLEVMDSLPLELLEHVQTAGASSPDEVRFTLVGGGTVLWGSADDSDLKAAVLETLLDVPAQVYNVAAPLNPITS